MYGFSNALAFSLVDDADIAEVENLIKSRTLTILTVNSNEGKANEHGSVLADEQLKEYFGEMYFQNPNKFEFLPGDKKLIKYLVTHIKNVVASKGLKKGMKQFNPTKNSVRVLVTPKNNEQLEYMGKYDAEQAADIFSELRTSLFQKVIECLELFNVNEMVNLENISENIVSVSTHNNQIVGDIYCILCADGKKKSRPKRVSYNSKYWIPSNFTTHLKNVHKLVSSKSKSITKNTEIQQIDTDNDEKVITLEAAANTNVKTENIGDENNKYEIEYVENENNLPNGSVEIVYVEKPLKVAKDAHLVSILYNQISQ